MDLLSLIKTRRAVREFQKKPVPRELLEQISEAGRWAPSGMNSQPWRFEVVTQKKALEFLAKEAKSELIRFLKTPDAIKEFGEGHAKHFLEWAEGEKGDMILYNAPAAIFVIQTDPNDSFGAFDLGLATQNMMLYAHSVDLGTCCIGLIGPLNKSKKAREILKLTKDEKIVVAVIVGYPAEKSHLPERKEDVVSWIE